MKTRIIQTRFWEDDIVLSVSSNARYLWIFLLTNKDLGMTNYVHIPDTFISYYTGLSINVLQNVKEELQKTGRIFFIKDWVFIPNLEKFNNYKNSPRNVDSYNKELSFVPQAIVNEFSALCGTMDTSIHTSNDSNYKSKIRNKKSETQNQKQEIKNTDNVSFERFIEVFNLKRKSNFKPIGSVKKKYEARLKEGYTSKQLMMALLTAMKDDFHKDNNFKYLTPEFICRSDKLERYLNSNN